MTALAKLESALRGCVEHMEHSTPQGRAAYEQALTTLSARASAGEGGDLATALRKWQAVLRGDAECAGLNNGYRNACEHHAAHIDTLLTAAPQPAQAGASGGGVPVDSHRWNIERDGDALLICDGEHEKSAGCEYVRYVRAPASPATGEGKEKLVPDWSRAYQRDGQTFVPMQPAATPQPAQAGASGGGEAAKPLGYVLESDLAQLDANDSGTIWPFPAEATDQISGNRCGSVPVYLAPASPATDHCTCPSETRCAGTCPYYLRLHATPQPAEAQGVRAFQPGDRIEWQGMNGTWFPGKIVAVRDRVTTYDAKLDDGCDAKDFAAGRFRMLSAAPQPQEGSDGK